MAIEAGKRDWKRNGRPLAAVTRFKMHFVSVFKQDYYSKSDTKTQAVFWQEHRKNRGFSEVSRPCNR